MATNLDKSENTLTEVQSVSFVRGIDGSGNSVRISAANLASVLGANITVISTQNADPDSFTKAGAYQYNNWDNTKAPSTSGVLYIPLWRDGYWRFEYFVGTSPGQLWYRRGASSSWSQWVRICDETQDVLAPIAGSVSDLNTIVKPCTTLTDRNASNAPESNKFGYLTCLKFQSYLAQIWIDMSLTKVYIRSVNASSGWSGITWRILVQNITSNAAGKNLTVSDDMDNIVEPGAYGVQNTPLHSPINYGLLEVVTSQLYDIQRATRTSDKAVYIRMKGHSVANYSGIEFTKVF